MKVDVLEGIVTVSLALNIKYDYSNYRSDEKSAGEGQKCRENMTGLEVADVNIKVAGVEMEKQD